MNEIFRQRGILFPKPHNFSYLRQWLEMHGFVKNRIHGLKEFWIISRLKINESEEYKSTYTPELFAAKFFPGISRPLTHESQLQIETIMRSRGLVKRGIFENSYWSYKETRRAPTLRPLPKPAVPRHVRLPRGSFNLLELLELNKMKRTPENLAWARQFVQERAVKIQGTHRYAVPDARGDLPPIVTGQWTAPVRAFTTYEFQVWNNLKKPTAKEWKSAVEWLESQGFKFIPSWGRWIKQ